LSESHSPDPDRIRGVLWGLAAGDALGAPLEGLKEGHIRQLFGTVQTYVDLLPALPEKPWRWRRPGLHTDDTQQALLLVEALFSAPGKRIKKTDAGAGGLGVPPKVHSDADIEDQEPSLGGGGEGGEKNNGNEGFVAEGGRRPHPVVDRLARLYLALASPPGFALELPVGAHRGTGANFRTVLTGLSHAECLDDDGSFSSSGAVWRAAQPSAGTGAAMRIAPLGAWNGADTEEDLIRLAIEVSLITHNDPRGISAAVALAFGVHRLLRVPHQARIEARDFITSLVESVHGAEDLIRSDYAPWLDSARDTARDHDLSSSLGVVASLVEEHNDDLARRTLVTQARGYAPIHPVTQPNHGFAPVALPMALYRALSAPGFAVGLEATINDGGDADTMGAMVGALLGARFGLEAIPQEWRDGLVARVFIGQRAEALARSYRGRPWDDLLTAEAGWTRDEDSARRAQVESHENAQDRKSKRDAGPRKGKSSLATGPGGFSRTPGDEPMAPWLPGGLPSSSRRKGRKRGGSRPFSGKPPGPSASADRPSPDALRDLPFAPPPEIWLRGTPRTRTPDHSPDLPPTPPSSEEKKKDKAARGRKRIPWKEDRRRKQRGGEDE